jgi:hypothetical protein
MSAVIVVTPLIIAGWPAITAAVTAALGTLGYSACHKAGSRRVVHGKTRAEVEIEDSEILDGGAGTDEQLVVEKDGIRAIFSRDARGALKLCMESDANHSKSELRKIAGDLIGRVTQQYVYNRMITELKERHMTVVDEEVAEDRTIRIRVRNS